MTGTLCQSAALGRIIATWVVKIAELFGIIVKTILSMVENAWCREAGWPGVPRAIWPCLSRPASLTFEDACALPTSRRRRRESPKPQGSIATRSCPQAPKPRRKVKGFRKESRQPLFPHVRERSENIIGADARR